jgi:5-oxoprolinase (ATP-hydrolysing)
LRRLRAYAFLQLDRTQVGRNLVVRAGGQIEVLAHIGQAEMKAGDVFEIHTPGGGGFGGR